MYRPTDKTMNVAKAMIVLFIFSFHGAQIVSASEPTKDINNQLSKNGSLRSPAQKDVDNSIPNGKFSQANNFLCFGSIDNAGRGFQQIFSTPEGQVIRSQIDCASEQIRIDLLNSVNGLSRDDLKGCLSLLDQVISNSIEKNKVTDPLAKSIIAANACGLLTIMTTNYDFDSLKQWSNLSLSDKVGLRNPTIVYKRGQAVCGGIADIEQYFAQSIGAKYNFRCLKTDGHTRVGGNAMRPTSENDVNHSWVTYVFGDGKLWAPSDTTDIIYQSNLCGIYNLRPKALVSANNIVVIDPFLRDVFHIYHEPVGFSDGYKLKLVPHPEFTLLSYYDWSNLNNSNSQACYVAKQIENYYSNLNAAALK